MRILFLFVLLILLIGCVADMPDNFINSQPLGLVTDGTPAPTDWTSVAPGIEQRLIIPNGFELSQMVTLRLDPAQVTFRVHYQPGNPLTLAEWKQALPDALAFINANFFTPEHTITGMLVTDSAQYGSSFTDRGGMFSIQGGMPVIQSLVQQPYDGRPLEQAVQAFPYLVSGGQPAYTRANDTRPSRRTVIGLDAQGRVLLLATPGIGPGLYDLSQFLPTAGIDLVEAFNLDGGGSTLMAIVPTGYALNSYDPVPAVLAVYAR